MKTFLVVKLAPFSSAWKWVTTIGDLVKAWHDGYDFKIEGGPYCSNRDQAFMEGDGIEGVIIKHGNDTAQVKF